MDSEFDFRLHTDRSGCVGTQYFEFVPGPYRGTHWVPGGPFIDENTFCLFEGIFERHVPNYDHFAVSHVVLPQLNVIVIEITALEERLLRANGKEVNLPYGGTLRVEDTFRRDVVENQRRLATLLSELEIWLRKTLTAYDCVSVLRL